SGGAPGGKTGQGLVIEKENTERKGQPIEKSVVARGEDQQLKSDQQPGPGQADSARHENQKRRTDFDCEHGSGGKVLKQSRELVGVPGNDVRQGLCMVVKIERAQVMPRWIAAQQFYAPRHEVETEHEEAEQPNNDGGAAQEDRQKSGFEQQSVP